MEREMLKRISISEYNKGARAIDIIKKYSIPSTTFRKWIKRPAAKTINQKKWTEEENTILFKLYPTSPKEEITKSIPTRNYKDICKHAIQGLGLKRNQTLCQRYIHRITIDDDYFKKWNDKMAYILGFITADGCIHKNRLFIYQQTKDKDVLESITNELGSNIKIRNGNGGRCSRISIRSDTITKDLITLGLKENKKYNNISPPHMETKFIPHYLRGLIDGDGGVYVYQKPKEHIELLLRGVEGIMTFAHYWFNNISGSKAKLQKEKTKNTYSYRVIYAYNNAIKILNWLYKDATIFLKRKHEVYVRFVK